MRKSIKDPNYLLWMLFVETYESLFKLRVRSLKELRLQPINIIILLIVEWFDDNVTPAMIAQLTHREPHSISMLLSRMEKQGYLKKTKDLPRKNNVRVSLTKKGYEIINSRIANEHVSLDIFSALSKLERKQFKSCLEKLRIKAMIELDLNYTKTWQSIITKR